MSNICNIKEFDMGKVKDGKTIIFIGKRNTGKSVLVLDYLYHNQDFPIGTCISPTDEYNRTFADKIPPQFIFDKFEPELLQRFIHRQKNITKLKNTDTKYANVDTRAFLILDDCLFDAKNWISDENIRFTFMNGRHVGITFLLTMQYLLGIPPALRENVDYIFICKANKKTTKKKLYDHYCGMFDSFEIFEQVLDECTKDYGCLVIDNTTPSDKLEDQVYWYKADITRLKNIKLCEPQFWNMKLKNNIVDDTKDFEIKQNFKKNSKGKGNNYAINRIKKENREEYYD